MYNIKLNSKNSTLKVVKLAKRITLRHSPGRVTLKQTGSRGPQGLQGDEGPQGEKGDKGDTGVSTFVRAHHGSDPNMARPSALYVEWVGSVAPLNATIEDTWIDTA